MILYHPPTHSALHCATGCYSDTIEGLVNSPPPFPTTNNYLLVRHPLHRLRILYRQSRAPTTFKNWVFSAYTAPCCKVLSNPDAVVRYEWFIRDMRELGIEANIADTSPPEISVCLATRAYIRKTYAEDYRLGDYD